MRRYAVYHYPNHTGDNTRRGVLYVSAGSPDEAKEGAYTTEIGNVAGRPFYPKHVTLVQEIDTTSPHLHLKLLERN